MYQATPPAAAAPRPAQRRVLDELFGVSVEYLRKPELLKAEALFGAAGRAAKREEERREERTAEENMVGWRTESYEQGNHLKPPSFHWLPETIQRMIQRTCGRFPM